MNESYLSMQIGRDLLAAVTEKEFEEVCHAIKSDPELFADAIRFRARWKLANESSDENAFAEPPDRMIQFMDVVRNVCSDPNAASLTSAILMKFLSLR